MANGKLSVVKDEAKAALSEIENEALVELIEAAQEMEKKIKEGRETLTQMEANYNAQVGALQGSVRTLLKVKGLKPEEHTFRFDPDTKTVTVTKVQAQA